jgi:hypothetical protein
VLGFPDIHAIPICSSISAHSTSCIGACLQFAYCWHHDNPRSHRAFFAIAREKRYSKSNEIYLGQRPNADPVVTDYVEAIHGVLEWTISPNEIEGFQIGDYSLFKAFLF